MTKEDGLSSTSFTSGYRAIMQDREGFLWFGTRGGLNRYDGYQFKTFLNDPKDPTSISSDPISALWQDYEGKIWVGTNDGVVNRLDPATNQFSRFAVGHDGKQTSKDSVRSIVGDGKGKLWIGTIGGLYQLTLKGEIVTRFDFDAENPTSISDSTIRSIYIDNSSQVWVGTSAGINRYNPTTSDFRRYLFNAEQRKTDSIGVNSIFENEQGLILAGTEKGLYRYDSNTDAFYLVQINSNISAEELTLNITSIIQDSQNQIWLGTANTGLCLLQLQNKVCHIYKKDESDKHSLTFNMISDLYHDQQGRIWVSSLLGLNYFSANRPFASYSSKPQQLPIEKAVIGAPVTETMFDKSGSLWVGHYDIGLIKYNQDHQIELVFKHDPSDPSSIGSNRITSLSQAQSGNIWVGTHGKGLYQFDNSTNTFKHFDKAPLKVMDIITDNNGNLWVAGSRKPLVKLDPDTGDFTDVYEQYNIFTTVTSLHLSRSNILWVGHLKGLTAIDLKLDTYKTYQHDPNDPNSISSNLISSLFEDQHNNLWVATLGGGINMLKTETESFVRYDQEDGLADDTQYSILEDERGDIWTATQNGLSKLNPSTNIFTNYYVKDGLPSDNFDMAFSISKSGEIALGSYKGVVRFFPSATQTKEPPGNLSFTSFKLFNKPISVNKPNENTEFLLQQSIETSEEINLTYKELLFSFEFALLNSLTPKKIKYAYQLSGWDDDWIYTDYTNRVATYTNIPHGEYQLKLKATDKNGNWKDDIKSIKLTISPPFWKTNLAYFTYVVLTVLLAYFIVNMRTRSLVRRASALEKSVERRTSELASEKEKVEQLLQRKNEEFANVSHEFRTPLTLILGPLAQLLKTNQDVKNIEQLNIIQRNSYRLLRMVDQLLNLETIRVRTITQQSPQAIGSIIQQLAGAFVDFAQEKGIELRVGHIEAINFKFTSDALEKIIANLLSNAIKYTSAGGKIKICSERTPANQLLIEISDTGVGIPEDKLDYIFERYSRVLNEKSEQVTGAGIGLALVKDLVEAHGGEITIQSKEGKGTTVKVLLPIVDEVDSDQVNPSDNQEIIAMELIGITNQFSDSQEPMTDIQTETVSDKPSVLVVEDNQDMRSYITERIKSDYKVITATNGQEGIDKALAEIPDLIISDIMMPHKDGYELTHELRQNPVTSHIPVMLLTARDDRESRLKGWYEKADEYLTKPFDVEELTIRMSNLLGIRNILKKRYSDLAFQIKPQAAAEKQTTNEKEAEASPTPDSEERNPVNKLQENFIKELNSVLEKHYTEASTSVITLATDIAMSERQFFRKLRSIMDMTPTDYLRRYRLEKSRDLLEEGISVKQVTFDVGFNSQSYFSRCFRAQYGVSPTEYAKGPRSIKQV